MKLFILGLIAIALSPMAAIAEPLNMPFCYMITARGRLVNLNYLCERNMPTQTVAASPKITADDLCGLAATERRTATNQFQADEANKILNLCQNDRGKVEAIARLRLSR